MKTFLFSGTHWPERSVDLICFSLVHLLALTCVTSRSKEAKRTKGIFTCFLLPHLTYCTSEILYMTGNLFHAQNIYSFSEFFFLNLLFELLYWQTWKLPLKLVSKFNNSFDMNWCLPPRFYKGDFSKSPIKTNLCVNILTYACAENHILGLFCFWIVWTQYSTVFYFICAQESNVIPCLVKSNLFI